MLRDWLGWLGGQQNLAAGIGRWLQPGSVTNAGDMPLQFQPAVRSFVESEPKFCGAELEATQAASSNQSQSSAEQNSNLAEGEAYTMPK